MKKVISALTAAAMCASMSASVMTAFAVYSANDVEFYLKVVDGGAGTVSADGKTITFADAAAAKGAKITVQEFIKADASNPSVQQVGSTFEASAKGITLGTPDADGVYTGVSYAAAIGEQKEYTLNGVTVKTDNFVSCFAYANKLKKFKNGTGDASWGSSRNYSWAYDGPDQLSIIWASDFADTSRENYKETAAFAADPSDTLPFTQFDATLEDLADGTYTIDIADTWEHGENGTQHGTFINVDGKNKVEITNHSGITIVIGEGGTTPSEDKPTEAPSEDKPTEAPSEDKPTEAPTETPSDTPVAVDKSAAKEWTWYFDDTYYDPETGMDGNGNEGYVAITAYVTKDPGSYGFDFTALIDGKSFTDQGFEVVDIAWAEDGGYPFETFMPNPEKGHVGAASKQQDNSTLADGTAVITFFVIPPEDAQVGKTYEITFKDLTVGDSDQVKHTPATVAGTLTIGKSAVTPTETPSEDKPTETPSEDKPTETPSEDKPTETPSEDQPTETPSNNPSENPTQGGDASYLYGDVNENGKVELVDIVKLNRFLTGLDSDLSAVATVNANCYRANKESDADTKASDLNGKDSVEILRYLIGLVTDLPTQG